ncbi:PREDICTED: transcription factor bHLH112-like [Nicotiana attenuata]|uniref:Transcription factor bhlh112 n=1 Tax=Nicotiana attenuata TaxID=49451 RepID=A0A1J6JYS1_NICAT|nr:PREDICTED: transcription factor bHLH112-like [Nicotiana attenuata]OIT22246.1 transcription factor bhlh112 [Nicotiana attenuata]
MADEYFQAGVCGENSWWNSTKNIFGLSPNFASSIFDDPIGNLIAWPISDLLDMKTKVDLSSPSSTLDWNHTANDKLDNTYPSMLQEDINSSLNYQQENGLDCPNKLKRNFSSITQDSSTNSKPMNQDFTYYSDLLQTLFDTDPDQPPQQSFLTNNQPINCTSNKRQNLNDFAPSLPNSSEIRASLPHITSKSNIEEIRESTSSSYKRPRIETPSPLPTFKVRKEKMGDRITALQQLVSPFGKTDTASVLQEAIEYIKFLHDQVNVLSNPYMKKESSTQYQQVKEQEGLKQDLRSQGLCLVPISSTFPVTAETTMDFWTPTFGATFK